MAASSNSPSDIRVVLQWNGHAYPVTFRLTHEGEAVPPAFTGAPAMQLVGFAPRPTPAAASRSASFVPAADADPYAAGRRAAAVALAASGGSDAD